MPNRKTTQPKEGTIGYRLMVARKKAGYKFARDFSRAKDIPDNSYYCHESNRRIPRDQTLQYYAQAMNVSYDWLKHGGSSKPKEIQLPSIPVRAYPMTAFQEQEIAPYTEEFLEGHILKDYPLAEQFAARVVTNEFSPMIGINTYAICVNSDWRKLSNRDYLGLSVRERHETARELFRMMIYIPTGDGSGLHVPATRNKGKAINLAKCTRMKVEGVILATLQIAQ